jgi:hypothetical protein
MARAVGLVHYVDGAEPERMPEVAIIHDAAPGVDDKALPGAVLQSCRRAL